MELTLENLQELINGRKQAYANPDDAISAYNREIEISREYNGRQILELIQNADDAGASEMHITIDKLTNTLSVYNNGEPFSIEGIKSIMIPDLSSKVSSSFIGNKGLGFRSVLFWTNEIDIETCNLMISFSSEIAMKIATEIGLNIDEIRESRNLSENSRPFPVLAIPNMTSSNIEKESMFHIHYKPEYTEKIEQQIEAIDEKTLLFLNNIKRIVINKTRVLSVNSTKVGSYFADGQEWNIITEENELPDDLQDSTKNEKKKYGIKIAFPTGNASPKYHLYNYLPTQEEVSLPYLIHATLELDSSRNHVNQNETNEFIIGEIARTISKLPCRSEGFPPLSPLRTVRATFTAYGSRSSN